MFLKDMRGTTTLLPPFPGKESWVPIG